MNFSMKFGIAYFMDDGLLETKNSMVCIPISRVNSRYLEIRAKGRKMELMIMEEPISIAFEFNSTQNERGDAPDKPIHRRIMDNGANFFIKINIVKPFNILF